MAFIRFYYIYFKNYIFDILNSQALVNLVDLKTRKALKNRVISSQ
jgi:hypothetical protein